MGQINPNLLIMKKLTLLVSVFTALILLNCSTEEVNNEEFNLVKDPNFRVYESNSLSRDTYDDPCVVVDLIAGQNYVAGTVSIDVDEQDLILTYRTVDGWSIEETHMSIGDCGEQWVPTTGAGNPKIGQFEHASGQGDDITEVIYLINKDAVSDIYCFAAHAVVQRSGARETAWAEGVDFGGNSWAMYVEARKSDCDVTGGGPLK